MQVPFLFIGVLTVSMTIAGLKYKPLASIWRNLLSFSSNCVTFLLIIFQLHESEFFTIVCPRNMCHIGLNNKEVLDQACPFLMYLLMTNNSSGDTPTLSDSHFLSF